MGSLNKVLLIGNLGKDPEFHASEGGTSLCRLRLATTERGSDRDGEGESRTEWHNVVAFGRLAEVSRDYLKKGRKVYVEGRIRTRSYQKDGGPAKWFTEIIARDIQFLEASGAATKPNADAEF